MKRSELIISALLVPIDYVALLAAAWIAYAVRYTGLADNLQTTVVVPFAEYARASAIIALGWIAIYAFAGCYALAARRRWTTEFGRVIFASSTGFALVLAVIVFSREFFASRFIVLAVWPIAIISVIALRIIIRVIERACFTFGVGVHRVVLIGSGRPSDALAEAFAGRPGLGFRIVSRYAALNDQASVEIVQAWQCKAFDEIIDGDSPDTPRVHALLDFCAEHHIPVRYSADFLSAHAPRISIETYAGVPLVEVYRTRLLGWGRIVKRIFDIKAAIILLILTSPILILVAIVVKCSSRGPVFFRQERIGQAGRPFRFVKFRSMRVGAHEEWEELRKHSERPGIIPKIKDDPRVTRIGRFLRRWSLDELPQLFNVLAGTMSLVGPRPHLPQEVAEYAKRHKVVLEVKPGITGLAQVSGRADLDFEDEVKLDTYYIENWSPALDLVILLRTPFAVIRKRGAY